MTAVSFERIYCSECEDEYTDLGYCSECGDIICAECQPDHEDEHEPEPQKDAQDDTEDEPEGPLANEAALERWKQAVAQWAVRA